MNKKKDYVIMTKAKVQMIIGMYYSKNNTIDKPLSEFIADFEKVEALNKAQREAYKELLRFKTTDKKGYEALLKAMGLR